MELRIAKLAFVAMLMILEGTKALTCSNNTLKVTIKTLPDEYDFDAYEQYELRATIAYSVQKYCGEGESSPKECDASDALVASDVTLSDISERISMCVEVDNFSIATVRQAIRLSKANLNGALLLTDQELYVDGILPTLSPVPEYDFAPWLIAYIVIFCLIIIGGVVVVLYSRFHKSQDTEVKDQILAAEEGSLENVSGSPNEAFDEIERVRPQSASVEETDDTTEKTAL